MAFFKLAWRNLWRNKRRTAITLAAVTLNTGILIISYALMDGMLQHTVSNATNIVVGEAQMHATGYREDRSFFKSIANPEDIISKAANLGVKAAPRSYGYGLVSVGVKSAGALFWGVQPTIERSSFDLAVHVEFGEFLSDAPNKTLVLGKKLARSLNASVGTELIVVVQAADGSLGNDLYIVAGILKSAGDTMDRAAALMHQDDFTELFVSGGRIHEIAFNTFGAQPLTELVSSLESIAPVKTKIRSWREILPGLSDMVNIFDVVIWIFGAVFFLTAGLGVMNTMLMATYERMREFGILKAIGTTPLRIVINMAVEAFVLTMVASVLGTVLGVTVSLYLQAYGIDTSSLAGEFTMSGVAFDPVWKAVLTPRIIIIPVVAMCVICTLAGLYPAVIAARIQPVKAIHHV